MHRSLLALSLIALLAAPAPAEEPMTRQLAEGAASPPATLDQVAWLTGHWQGEAFGGIAEEVWSPPQGDSMMCAFRLIADGKVSFYEIVIIRQVGETLLLQLKHFNGDLTGWEEKDETVDFPLVEMTEDTAFFAGFTLRRVSENEITMWVLVGGEDGNQEAAFRYKRVG